MSDSIDKRDAAAPAAFDALAVKAPVLAALLDEPGKWALFLDVDGTLVDIAPTPEGVEVPAGLANDLVTILAGLEGAMALITGRGIASIDRLFQPWRFPLAGLHGAEVRLPDGRTTATEPTPALQRIKDALQAEARNLPGIIVEDKGAAVALHYRLAPHHREHVDILMREAAALVGPGWKLQPGKMVVELKPAAASKGEALKSFMREAPYAARKPIAIGDDLTDEDMFAAAIAHGGEAVRIGEATSPTLAAGRVQSPAQLRRLLASIAGIWAASRRGEPPPSA